MNKTNNKFIKQCITEALLELMKEKDFKEITISEISKKAGTSRMAYYRNYNYKEDILNDHMSNLIDDYNNMRKEHLDTIYNRFLFAYKFIKDNSDFIISMENSNLSVIIQNKINEYMKTYYKNSDESVTEKYRLYILSGGLYNSSKMWILNGTKESPEMLAEIFVNRLFNNTD